MADKKWRGDLDLVVEQNLNELILETKEYDGAIKKAKNRSKAQMWIALALINHKLNTIISKKDYKKKIPKEELSEILDTLEKL